MSDTTTEIRGSSRFAIWMVVALIIVVADQATKWAIIQWIPLYDVIPLSGLLNITHHQNPGAAWSFLADAGGWQRWVLSGLAFVVSIVLVVWLWRIRNAGQHVLAAGLVLVLAGAVGNLVDRVRLGYVTDFIQVYLGEAIGYFPSFNVADAAISVGAALLIIDTFFFSGREEAAAKA